MKFSTVQSLGLGNPLYLRLEIQNSLVMTLGAKRKSVAEAWVEPQRCLFTGIGMSCSLEWAHEATEAIIFLHLPFYVTSAQLATSSIYTEWLGWKGHWRSSGLWGPWPALNAFPSHCFIKIDPQERTSSRDPSSLTLALPFLACRSFECLREHQFIHAIVLLMLFQELAILLCCCSTNCFINHLGRINTTSSSLYF